MGLGEFERPSECESCGQRYIVKGSSLNPSNETQSAMVFPCPCGGRVIAHVPGSTNRSLVRLEKRSD
jgi:hypothetical protein